MESENRGAELTSGGVQPARELCVDISDPVDGFSNLLDGEDGAQTSGEHRINVTDPILENENLDGEEGARENQVNTPDPVPANGNLGGQAVSRNLTRRILLHVGFPILVFSGALLFSVPFRLIFRLQTFVAFCGVFVGLMLVFLAVFLS